MHAGPPAWRRGGCQRWRKRWPCGLRLLSFVFLVRWPDRAATSRGPPRLPRALRPCPPASGFHRGPVSSPRRLSERRRMNCLRLGGLTSRGPNPLLHPRELPAPLNKPRGVWPARSTPSVCQERRQHPLAVLGPRTRELSWFVSLPLAPSQPVSKACWLSSEKNPQVRPLPSAPLCPRSPCHQHPCLCHGPLPGLLPHPLPRPPAHHPTAAAERLRIQVRASPSQSEALQSPPRTLGVTCHPLGTRGALLASAIQLLGAAHVMLNF